MALLVAHGGVLWTQKIGLGQTQKRQVNCVGAAFGNSHFPHGDKGQTLSGSGLSRDMPFDEPAFKAHASNTTPDPAAGNGM